MKKIKALVIMVVLLVSLLPSSLAARGLVPEGVTLQGWTTTPNNEGKSTMINLMYTDGFSGGLQVSTPYNSAWKGINCVQPIILAYKEGFGSDLGGEGGIMGTDINFSPNVLAAMKVQNFNPAQVGGANIPPESTVLDEEQLAWLQRVGYAIPAEVPASKPEAGAQKEPAPVKAEPQPSEPQSNLEVKGEPEPKTELESAQVAEAEPSEIPKLQKADPSDPVGETVQSPATVMTQEMADENRRLAAADPPGVNEPKVSNGIAELASEQTEQRDNKAIGIGSVLAVVVLAALGGVYAKRRKA